MWQVTVEALEDIKKKEAQASKIFARALSGKEPSEIVEYLETERSYVYVRNLQSMLSSDRDRELNYLSELVSRVVKQMDKEGECNKLEEIRRLFKKKFGGNSQIFNEKFGRRFIHFWEDAEKNFWRTVWCVKKALGIKDELQEKVSS